MKKDQRLYEQQVGQLFKQTPIGIIATLVNASVVGVILWNLASQNVLLICLFATMCITVLRYYLLNRYRKASPKEKQARIWEILLIVGIGISGVLWGSTGIFLFPVESTAHQAFIAFVLAGMVAGAVGTYSVIITAFSAFSFPTLVPIFFRFLLIGDEIHIAMSTMAFLFMVLTFLIAKSIHVTAKELIELKEHFVNMVEERTAELIGWYLEWKRRFLRGLFSKEKPWLYYAWQNMRGKRVGGLPPQFVL